MRMFDGMDEEVVPKKKVEEIDGPLLTERDKMKIERRKRKDERQREVRILLLLQVGLSQVFEVYIFIRRWM